jgi:REP-associated tyrosine transposase
VGTRLAHKAFVARPLRLESFDYNGLWRYSVTTCTYQRQLRFRDESVVALALDQFLQAVAIEHCALLVYCFMPDHLHLLAAGTTVDAEFPRFMKLAKQRSGWAFRRHWTGRLWQEGYFERVLRNDESTPEVIRYIVNNPVRAGLVVKPADYPHWGSSVYTRDEILDFIADTRRT